jgi:RNA polymerase sigma-70 factor (ECF subfamily)
MTEHELLAEKFEADRTHLKAVAYRMLGSLPEAEDAVQEAWLRLSRSDARAIENLSGWLTTVVARVSLDMLRSRASRREEPYVTDDPVLRGPDDAAVDPEQAAMLADSVGLALLVVLDALDPAERLAFVLHDMFAVPFDEIAPIVGRTTEATRQLASRGRRRVQGAATPDADVLRQREVVSAFLAASRNGDFEALVAMLDPDVVLRSDPAAVKVGSDAERRGPLSVAEMFSGRAREARLALLGAAVGAVWAPGGTPRVAFSFTVVDGKITAVDIVADPEQLRAFDVVVLAD